jgi:hypothetical protein
VTADALEPPQHIGEMTSENPPVGVKLVDHHVAEILKEVHPLGVMRQDPRVEHVRIGQHEVGASAHGAPRVLRRIPVIGVHAHVGQRLAELDQLRELVLGEGLGRKQVEHTRLGLLHEGLEDGQIVAERLARGGGRNHHKVLALGHRLEGPRLMRIELLYPSAPQGLDKPRIEGGGKGRVDRGFGFEVAGGGDERAGARRGQEAVQDLLQRHGAHPMFSVGSLSTSRGRATVMPCSGSCRRSAGPG